MSNDGPVKIEDKQIIDMPFLYPDRILELSKKSALSSKIEIEPAVKATAKEVIESSMDSIDDEFDLSEDELEFLSPGEASESQARVDLSSKAADDIVIEEHKLSLLDFLIARSGYPIQDIENYSEHYRLQFENIILEKDGIFEKFFLAVQNNIELLSAEKGNEKKSKATITKEAREKALVDFGPAIFSRLGAYYAKDSKYYFEQNELAVELSAYFLKQLYQTPVVAKKMLQSHKNKVDAHHKIKLAELQERLPTTFYGEISELALIKDDFDLFLLSPSVLSLAQNQPFKFVEPSFSRGSLLLELQEVLERSHNLFRVKHGCSQRDMLSSVSSDVEYYDIWSEIETPEHELAERFSRISFERETEMLPSEFLNIKIRYFSDFLFQNNFDFNILNNLNAVEKIYIVKKFVIDTVNNILKPNLLSEIKANEGKIKAVKLQLTQARKRVEDKYLKDNHGGKALKDLSKELGKGAAEISANIKAQVEVDEECIRLNGTLVALENKQALASLDAIEKAAQEFKDEFIHLYHPEILVVKKALEKSYKELCDAQKATEVFLKTGGTTSCLTFLPIKISSDSPGPDRYECLVAMAGAEIQETDDAINAHALLEAFSAGLEQFNDFTFRYVGQSSHALDLLLKQIGKGLSGREYALSSMKQDILPVYEKSCAEKRLINELIALFSSYGEQVQVLGCDNIALPKYIDTTPERQKALAPVVEEPVCDDKKAKKKQASNKEDSSKKGSNYFTIDAKLSNEKDDITYLSAEHITCCSSCQAQKPAVMTVLFNALRQSEKLAEKQRVLLSAMPVKEEEKVSIVNADARHCGMQSGVIESKDARKTLVCSM
ncbi:hypothetical protein CC99x_006070 [Candidatus Berkiella cookevillensis]|uniref:Uncharacterized protein n=1 Tax=Candidatus Berkiella cookevillensis TaxID=437022 RepID=A0A0Q9YHA4_9GAMM|nr:hypothetical protein [Candidatus Berkiella cookevillensis]MCS5708471.1 hypothetical protein [Candidatus Berkiella cookevillensis]